METNAVRLAGVGRFAGLPLWTGCNWGEKRDYLSLNHHHHHHHCYIPQKHLRQKLHFPFS
jgi:hypothetical protein